MTVEDKETALRKKGREREGIALRDAVIRGINARFEDADISELYAKKDRHGHVTLASTKARGEELNIASRLAKKGLTPEQVAVWLRAKL